MYDLKLYGITSVKIRYLFGRIKLERIDTFLYITYDISHLDYNLTIKI